MAKTRLIVFDQCLSSHDFENCSNVCIVGANAQNMQNVNCITRFNDIKFRSSWKLFSQNAKSAPNTPSLQYIQYFCRKL